MTPLALFRLRAFENDWLIPLLAAPSNRLTARLIAEAVRWRDIGQHVGYFASDRAVEVPVTLLNDGLDGFFAGDPPEIDPVEYEDALTDAQEDLTSARREFLRLVFDADDNDWHARFADVLRLVEELRDRPQLRWPAPAVDNIAWALDDAESAIPTRGFVLPAHWRSSDWTFMKALNRSIAERLGRLEEARAAIQEAAQHLAPTQPLAPHAALIGAPRVTTEAADSLGIATEGGSVTKMVARGTRLPASITETFGLTFDGQSEIEIRVLRGEGREAIYNEEVVRAGLGTWVAMRKRGHFARFSGIRSQARASRIPAGAICGAPLMRTVITDPGS